MNKEPKVLEINEDNWETELRGLYEDWYNSTYYNPLKDASIYKYIRSRLPKCKLIDIGCGIGLTVHYAREDGHEAYGIDLANVEKFWKSNGVQDYCLVAPAHKIPFPDRYFDFFTCICMMEHIPIFMIDKTLTEIYRICDTGGIFAIDAVERHTSFLTFNQHITLKPIEWWKDKLIKNGFQVFSEQIAPIGEGDIYILWVRNDTNRNNG